MRGPTTRIHIEVTEELAREMAELQNDLQIGSRKDLFCTGIEVLLWMVKKKREGKSLMAVNPTTGQATELGFLGFDRVKEKPHARATDELEAVA